VADYEPTYGKPQSVTLTAGAAITGGQLVAVTADNTVSPTGAGPANFAGVAGHDAATGAPVTIYGGSGLVHETAITSGVASGALVYAGAAGQITGTPGSNYGAVAIGVATRTVSGAGTQRWKTLVG
jgi:hypothetical protein